MRPTASLSGTKEPKSKYEPDHMVVVGKHFCFAYCGLVVEIPT